MKTWGSGCIAPPFLTSASDGGGWSASHSSRITPGEERSVPTGQEAEWASGGSLDVVEKEKILPLPEFKPRYSSPQLVAVRTELSRLLPNKVTNVKYIILT
jgi:hypothetical protein